MGVRFVVTGGREGWVRTVLTAVGVGLGVSLLMLTTALPSALAERKEREDGRKDLTYGSVPMARADDTVVVADTSTDYRSHGIRGRLFHPEGPRAPLPPGIPAYPGDGEMYVSPALDRLLRSGEGELLRERLPYRIAGTIADEGLQGPLELTYYAGHHALGTAEITAGAVERIDFFGTTGPRAPLDPILMLLVLVVLVALLMPVAVFIATAVRFGGERRDRRLAALRLVGADGRMTRRIAAGEAMAGALFGLLVGAGIFLVARRLAGRIELFGISVFPADLTPAPALVALVAVLVPAAAVAVTLFALRGVVIEPLGVVRTTRPRRRRLWWRLLLPVLGLLLLAPMIGQGSSGGYFSENLVVGGTLLLLVGVTALLPWVVEAVVARLGPGPVSWQLAVRRLQLSSGTAARMVNGIAVAVAGAIALQMLFAGVEDDYTELTGQDVSRAQMQVYADTSASLRDMDRGLTATRGVERTTALRVGGLGRAAPEGSLELTVGTCAALREVARLPSCREGDVFVVGDGETGDYTREEARPGRTLYVDPSTSEVKGADVAWVMPQGLKVAKGRDDPSGYARGGVLATPGAVPAGAASAMAGRIYIELDRSVPDVYDLVRNTVARADALTVAQTMEATRESGRFKAVRTGLFAGAACVLMLIGASILVSQLEQLRERRKLLSSLVAFGTRRRTLCLSVLWQAALPIALGLVLAVLVGVTLGAVLLSMVGVPFRIDWASVFGVTGIAAGVVLLVTALSMPALLRLMRPDGLRTE
ncbi:ABC transporter permease [Streptomyces sp. NPDC004609]|uniref:ABC transporter permease n=1 Tax=Streptomyces sp. NPDC004609 TaxID=3364704 RepID=UPI0036A71A4B